MIRWILIILLVIVLIFGMVFVFQKINGSDDENVAETSEVINGEVANNGEGNNDQAPVVVSDSVATSEGQPVTGNVLANDTDPQGDALTVNIAPTNGPNNGTLELNPDGSFTYTPNAGYVGTDGFAYQVCDADGNCKQGATRITVNSSADSEVAAVEETEADDSGQGGESETQPPATDASEEGSSTTTDETNTTTESSVDEGSNTETPSEDSSSSTSSTDTTSSSESDPPPPTNPVGTPITDPMTHTVKQGEWLIQIARCYGAAPETIVGQNYVPYPGWIMPGELLTISGVGTVSEPFLEPCTMFYTVQQGDTLYSIAQTYKVDLDMLMKANFGCYGYGSYYAPPVPTPYEDEAQIQPYPYPTDGWYMNSWYGYGPGYGAKSPYVYTGCYFPSSYNPTIYVGQELVIPVNLENADMRPVAEPK